MLKLPDIDKPFEVYTDALEKAIGGVLVQEDHPIVFEIQKLRDAEQCYLMHNEEMVVVVHCLETWLHYLLGPRLMVVTNNMANTYFKI